MDKNAIKKFAVWARRELIARVSQRAAWYGITEKDPIDEKAQVIHGNVLTEDEQAQRRALIAHIRREGYQQVMEEVAYTWFNRFIALRFMEVNGFLPSYTRVFSDDNGAYNPPILKDAIHLDLEGLDMEKVYAMEEANETEALFKYLVITQCNDLSRVLPGMFQKISDYTELLFPDFLLREGSVTHQMVTTIPEDDWKDAVQIIGWLYQYYNAEPKDEVFAALKKNIKISKEKIPAATQLFTPDWIVRYMVENSLGRLWVEGHPNDDLKASWKYYLEEAPQEPEVETQLAAIRAEYAQIDPASILCADPCMGSGHILVYMFDVLMQIYLSYGYTTNEAVESIVCNNLWGMDIDDRAAQLAYFAVMMKAQQYDHRWLAKQVRNPVQPHVFALQDSGDWLTFERQMKQAFANHPSLFADPAMKVAKALFDNFADAKEYGSIIQPDVTLDDLDLLEKVLDEMQQQADLMDFVAQADATTLMETLKPLILQCRALVQKYHVVVTNPPYMGNSGMSPKLSGFIRKKYFEGKSDIYAAFLMQCSHFSRKSGYFAMITQQSWMFQGTFKKLREMIVEHSIINMAHLGAKAFDEIAGEVVQTTTFVMTPQKIKNYSSRFARLLDYSGEIAKESALLKQSNMYEAVLDDFAKLPDMQIAYWVGHRIISLLSETASVKDFGDALSGLSTSDNEKFLRLWFEVTYSSISFSYKNCAETLDGKYKWVPHNKGGSFRRWYGNRDYIVNWENDGADIKYAVVHNPTDPDTTSWSRRIFNWNYFFRKGITWSDVATGKLSCRLVPQGVIFNATGPTFFANNDANEKFFLGLFNSNVFQVFLDLVCPGLHYNTGPISKLPVHLERVNEVSSIVEDCLRIAKEDWDLMETSWDFNSHPLVRGNSIEDAYKSFQQECEQRFIQLKTNEEALNQIFIDIYDLKDELTPYVDDSDVTVHKADLSRDIRSLISYAVGCIMGRYSLDKSGLVFSGGQWDGSQYITYPADHDGILPITDDEYFDDDIVGMFISWVRTVYGTETLENNLKFIAEALDGKGNPRSVIRQYFLNDFYKDHCNTYSITGSGKRPIYWLFDSGKKNGFKCLIYMHRYQPDTIARIRTDYLHETQARYRNAIETLERQSANASTSERVKMTKRLNALKAQAEEARVYEEKIHHLADQMIKIDLDDGVKVNYAKFADVLAPIK